MTAQSPLSPGLCCKTRKCRLSKILAKVSLSPVSTRDAFLKRIGRPPVECVQVDVVPRVRKHRTLQRPLESWLSHCRRLLQHNPSDSGNKADIAGSPSRANSGLMRRKQGLTRSAALVAIERSPVIAAIVIKRFKASGEAVFYPKLPCDPVCQSRSAMPQGGRSDAASPLGELRRSHQAGLHRDVSEVRGGDGLLVAICRRGEIAEHGDDLDHDWRPHRCDGHLPG
jgi:hypothetical protein